MIERERKRERKRERGRGRGRERGRERERESLMYSIFALVEILLCNCQKQMILGKSAMLGSHNVIYHYSMIQPCLSQAEMVQIVVECPGVVVFVAA